MAKIRGGGKVRGESVFANSHDPDQMQGIDETVAKELTPELADSIYRECFELIEKLEDETLQVIARRKLEGYSCSEITTELGLCKTDC